MKLTTYVYGHVFESLTKGLYPNKQEILREYIQNAYDAILDAKRVGLDDARCIKVQTDGNNLFIYDEGIGMGQAGIEEYKYFGFSRKRSDEHVGFRGIGKLAGLAVADRLVVVTSRKGEEYCYRYECEAKKMLEAVKKAKIDGINIPLDTLIESYTSINKEKEKAESHYTIVQLHSIHDDEDGYLIDPSKIISYLQIVAPVSFNCTTFKHGETIERKLKEYIPQYETVQITVNGVKVYKPFTDELPLMNLEFYDIKDRGGHLKGMAWVLSHKESKQIEEGLPRGLYYRVKGFAVGDETLVRTTIFSAGRGGMVYWYAGEIFILEDNIIPSSSRTDFEDTPERAKFYSLAKEQLAKPLNSLANERSKENQVSKKVDNAEKIIQNVSVRIQKNELPIETRDKTLADLTKARQQLERKKNDTKQEGLRIQVEQKIEKIVEVTKAIKKGEGIKNIVDELELEGDAKRVYEIMMNEVVKWFKDNSINEVDTIVNTIHKSLKRRF